MDTNDANEQARDIALRINGEAVRDRVPVRVTLADFLRQQRGLTGTHLGCEHGVCGACTVLVDGRSTRACLMLAVQANGREVTTVEGLAPADGPLHPLQQAFHECHGLQCGFCTPGMLTTLVELLAENPRPTEEEVRIAISGNLCRCTGYTYIVNAIRSAAAKLRAATPASAT
jgi:carbon-monoxide dehydrogenase small subunit